MLLIICNTVARESAVINEDLIMLGTMQPYSKVNLSQRSNENRKGEVWQKVKGLQFLKENVKIVRCIGCL